MTKRTKPDENTKDNSKKRPEKPNFDRWNTADALKSLQRASSEPSFHKFFSKKIDPSVLATVSNPKSYQPENLARLYKNDTFKAAEAEQKAKAIEVKTEEELKEFRTTPYVAKKLEDENFAIAFMNVGSGDCIFIKTPKGKTIVVDSGTITKPEGNKSEGTIRTKEQAEEEMKKLIKNCMDMLKSPTFLGGENQELYSLILTHADEDHYSLIPKIVTPCATKIRHVFYSCEVDNYSGNNTLLEIKKAEIFNQVNINDTGKSMNSNIKDKWNDWYLPLNEKGIQILGNINISGKNYDQWDEENCNIYLLAANVPSQKNTNKKAASDKKAEDDKNTASIVTLIEVYNRKILLCGDATFDTEKFLLKQYKDTGVLENIDLLHLEHHGSGTEHALSEFVYTVNPRLAAISSGPNQGQKNPRWNTVEKYTDWDKKDGEMQQYFQGKFSGSTKPKAHRLIKSDMDEHPFKYAIDQKRWEELKKWNYGIYTTMMSGNLVFRITKQGEIVREFRQKEDNDMLYDHIYTIGNDGKVIHDKKAVSS